jgi:ABC-type lipoprotein export system ATPase subunit
MLKDLTIENYRLFQKFALDSIARVNLIVGTNNSGKSSLLEAIYLLAGKGDRAYLFDLLNKRGEFTAISKDSHGMVSGGYQAAHIFHARLLKTGHVIEIESKLENSTSLTIAPGKRKVEGLDQEMLEFEYVCNGAEPVASLLPIVGDGFLAFSVPGLRSPASSEKQVEFVTTDYLEYDELARLWDRITLTPREDKVVKALQILEPDVERISFVSRKTYSGGVLLKLKGEGAPIPLGNLGDGMRRVLAIAAALVSAENGTLLVDEIDTGLYHETLTDVWRLIFETAVERNAQVFATTHSWDCVKSFQQALSTAPGDDVGRLIRLEPQDDHIQAIPYSRDELTVAMQHGIEVR